jgi:uncharacterized phage-associated protein
MCIHLHFDYQKATQVLAFFAEKEGGRLNKMKALKFVYFADRYHLRKYGRPITNDEYFAMPYGPVASGVKDLLEMSEFLGVKEKDYASQFIAVPDHSYIKVIQPLDRDTLSKTDLEALEFAWEKFGRYTEFELVELSHKYPEWQKHKQSLQLYSRVKMELEDFLEDPVEPDIEKCFALSPEDKQDALEELKELAQIEALWN